MASVETSYEVEPGGNGDAGFTDDNNVQNEPTFTADSCGRGGTAKYRSICLRYELDIPKLSPAVTVTKWRLTFKINNNANGGDAGFSVGLMKKDGLWDVSGWTEANYPDTGGARIGFPTSNANNTIIADTLVGDAWLGTATYIDGEMDSGATITVGEGYSGLTFETTGISVLQEWIDSADYTPAGGDSGATALILHFTRASYGAATRFNIFMDNHPTEPTPTLEIGYSTGGPIVGEPVNTRDAGQIPLRGLKHRALPVTAVTDADTLDSSSDPDIPEGLVEAIWEPDATGEPCAVSVSESSGVKTVTFTTDGVTSYDGTLHLWHKGA